MIADDYTLGEFLFYAKNSVIKFVPSKVPSTEEDLKSILMPINLISDIVFNNLNEGQELIFKGESENWEIVYNYKFYEHWYQDENMSHYENYSKSN